MLIVIQAVNDLFLAFAKQGRWDGRCIVTINRDGKWVDRVIVALIISKWYDICMVKEG